MPKNTMTKKNQEAEALELELENDDFDFDFPEESPDGEMFVGMMSSLINASNHQTTMALELTKLIITKNSAQNMSEEAVFSTFKKASAVVADSFPLKTLWETFG